MVAASKLSTAHNTNHLMVPRNRRLVARPLGPLGLNKTPFHINLDKGRPRLSHTTWIPLFMWPRGLVVVDMEYDSVER